ncbi:hypothetical protein GCM10011490_12630 [Pseudoclavibacter endophyticus]|uniref:Uncharacterized protein n=1 Tax=Pseudoclavibacter endophyticus TaxID=1778590 RepID=A0A6H9WKJ4_9MICO|nr:hypothetical protein [Pseudoclavibacter endophyticus]KAB1649326.1 hypothetical protein F8O04_03375 [Pseudoclavibacter endophyticus]GGA63485.1 hypothetical protein GCM10011490_12630 [Pseudoclavibacter endophyticus]
MTDRHGRDPEAGAETAPATPGIPALPNVELPPINRAPADRTTAGYLAATPGFADAPAGREAPAGGSAGPAPEDGGEAPQAGRAAPGAGDAAPEADAAAQGAEGAPPAPADGGDDPTEASGTRRRARTLWITLGVAVVLAAAATWFGLAGGFGVLGG